MAQKKAPPVPPLPPKISNNGQNSQGNNVPPTTSSNSSSSSSASSTQGPSSLTATNQSQTLARTTSAPTSPHGQPQTSLGGVSRTNGTANGPQSNTGSVKATKALPLNNVGGHLQTTSSQHPTLTASKSAPPSPSKEGVFKGE